MDQRFTRAEVERITGATRRQLDYWARMKLLRPRARWGERFFSFSDLVAIETLRQLAGRRISAWRLARAMAALERRMGCAGAPLSALRISVQGQRIFVHPPGADGRLLEPLTGQFVLNFEVAPLERKIRALSRRTAEEWFELGMALDTAEKTFDEAVDAYRKAIEASPDWIEARINLGATLFHLGRLEESRESFSAAVRLDPSNALARFNLGCLCDRLGDLPAAIEEFRAAVARSPQMADAHLNLALAYEKSGVADAAARHFSLYLRHDPQGPWADFARKRLGSVRPPHGKGKIMPFRRGSG